MAHYDADPGSDLQEEQEFHDDLKPGTELLGGQYVIERYLNAGGFGITYLAKDSLERPVVIKECFPSAFCQRGDLSLQVRSRGYEEKVRSIIDRFEEEAKALAKFSHPNIVGVHQVFKQNNTAYMVLDYVKGQDLSELVQANDPVLTHTNVVTLLTKLLKAIAFVHRHSMLHRDISPDNILVTAQGEPILIDFGAAKEQVSGDTRALSTLRAVKDGYSPQEFYIAGSEQSAASDLYSLAATFYYVVTRDVPADSQTRLAAIASEQPDPVVPLAKRATDLYDVAFCTALDKAMSVLLKDRVQSADDWLALMDTDGKVTPLQSHLRREIHAKPSHPAEDAADAKPAEAASATSERIVPRRPTSRPSSKPADASATKLSKDTFNVPMADQTEKKMPLPLILGSVSVLALAAVGYLVFGGSDDTGPVQVEVTVAAPEQVQPFAEPEVGEPETALNDVEPETAPLEETAAIEDTTPLEDTAAIEDTAPPAVAVEEVEVVEAPAPATEPAPVEEAAAEPLLANPVSVTVIDNPAEMAELSAALEALNASDPLPFGPDAGSDNEVSRVIQEPEETVSAVPAAAVAPATTEPTGDFIELQSVMSGWTVDLPFSASASDATVIGAVFGDAPVWLNEGSRILSVNGTEISAISEISDVVRGTVGETDATTLRISLTVEEDTTGISMERQLQVPVVRESILLNGLRFNTQREGDAWVTTVADTGNLNSIGLKVGDQVVALVSTNERIDGETTLRDIITRETAAGNSSFTFAVERDGSMYVETLTYAGIGL